MPRDNFVNSEKKHGDKGRYSPPPAGHALYYGYVTHKRYGPKEHRLRYPVFCLFLDLDLIKKTKQAGRSIFRTPWLRYEKFSLFSFYTKDHTSQEGGDLREQIEKRLTEQAEKQGKNLPPCTQIYLLTYPRFLGYGFNPVSFYYCYGAGGQLIAMVYEVNNIFRERHYYTILLPMDSEKTPQQKSSSPYPTAKILPNHHAEKSFYVSPFLAPNGSYEFRLNKPDIKIITAIHLNDQDGARLSACFRGRRLALTSKNLWHMLAHSPLGALKVMISIHIEAFKLWRKGLPFYKHIPLAAKKTPPFA